MRLWSRLLAAFLEILAIASDWFLILAGILLAILSVIRVDVVEARYILLGAGGLLLGCGLWYRRQRLRRRR